MAAGLLVTEDGNAQGPLRSADRGDRLEDDVELGARRDGTIVGLRVDILADMGASPASSTLVLTPVSTPLLLVGARCTGKGGPSRPP